MIYSLSSRSSPCWPSSACGSVRTAESREGGHPPTLKTNFGPTGRRPPIPPRDRRSRRNSCSARAAAQHRRAVDLEVATVADQSVRGAFHRHPAIGEVVRDGGLDTVGWSAGDVGGDHPLYTTPERVVVRPVLGDAGLEARRQQHPARVG